MHLSAFLRSGIFIASLVVLSGCSRDPIAKFSTATEVTELPELHQTSISDGLSRLFGTTANPRVRVVDTEAEEPAEGEPTPLVDAVDQKYLKHGAEVYNARCGGCHGVTGDGNGPAGKYLRPRPRDYRTGTFKFTSTPYGYKPARHDLVRTIRRGAKGTSMPAFPWMSDEDLNAVTDYVIFLSERGEVERFAVMMSDEYDEDEGIDFIDFTDGLDTAIESWGEAEYEVVLPVSAEPKYTEETVMAGRQLFMSQGCSKCHGTDGKGQTEWLNPEFLASQATLPEADRETINLDAWGEPAPAADLTARILHGGRRPIDIYRRIYTGINGTPMPAFGNVFANEPDSLWHLVHYVRHVIEGGDPILGIESVPEAEVAEEEVEVVEVVEEVEAAADADASATEDTATEDGAEVEQDNESAGAEPETTDETSEADDTQEDEAVESEDGTDAS
ncbi:c-type cytochrome [Planctomycetota bacterium]